MLAVMVRPAKAPAPTLSTNSSPVTTAPAPTSPPNGAHHGIPVTPSSVGSGLGTQRKSTVRNARTGRNDTTLASQGLSSALRNAPFMGGPQACSAPAAMIRG